MSNAGIHPDVAVEERRERLRRLQADIKGMANLSIELSRIERTLVGSKRRAIHEGRVVGVRQQSRATQLAYGFLRGRPYNKIEGRCHDAPDWDRVVRLIDDHTLESRAVWLQRYAEWLDDATLLPDHCRPKQPWTGQLVS